MIEVKVTDAMLIAAREKAVEMGQLNNSITRGQGNLAGFVGEEIALHVMGGVAANTYDYDLVLADGTKVDAKTKRTSVEPKPHYDCSVAKLNTKQDCDVYAFIRVHNDLHVGWFLGWLTKDEYYAKARYLKKGDVDPANNFKVKSDCYNVSIEELNV